MLRALCWYLVVQAAHLAFFPAAERVFSPISQTSPTTAHAFGKILALLAFATLLWLPWAWGIMPNTTLAAWGVLLVGGGACWSMALRRPANPSPKTPRPINQLLACEGVFFLCFAGFALFRAHVPFAWHTEQPMDMLMLNALWASPGAPPEDPWLSGHAIPYYYFGYWLFTALGRLTGQVPEFSYALGQSCWFALLAMGAYALGHGLISARAGTKKFTAPLCGALSMLCVAFAGTLNGVAQFLFQAPHAHWWWDSSRALTDQGGAGRSVSLITEFPAFSYILGDNHPHVLAGPFLLLVCGCALNLWLSAPQRSSVPKLVKTNAWPLAGAVLSCAVFLPLNTWDLPAAWMLLVMGASRVGVRFALLVSVLLPIGALALFFPYLLTAQSQAQGFVINATFSYPLTQLLLHLGAPFAALALLFSLVWKEIRPHWSTALWAFGLSFAIPWLLAACLPHAVPFHWERLLSPWSALWLATLFSLGAALLWQALRTPETPRDVGFACIIASTALLYLYAPEWIYVRDQFGTRMNTVFKFHYLAWPLLGLISAYAITLGLASRPWRAPAGMVLVCFLLTLVYPVAYAGLRIRENTGLTPTLSAVEALAHSAPGQAAMIRWINQNTAPHAKIVETAGDSYQREANRISVLTGRKTLLGWKGHESQWRGRASYSRQSQGREQALRKIYAPENADALRETLALWGVDYVYIGPNERRAYNMAPETEALLRTELDTVFSTDAHTLLKVRP